MWRTLCSPLGSFYTTAPWPNPLASMWSRDMLLKSGRVLVERKLILSTGQMQTGKHYYTEWKLFGELRCVNAFAIFTNYRNKSPVIRCHAQKFTNCLHNGEINNCSDLFQVRTNTIKCVLSSELLKV